jgi:hypothetical protein
MRRHRLARERVAAQPLTEALVLRALLTVWPRRNRIAQPNLVELLKEARDFGISTYGAYLRLLRRQRRRVIRYDRAPFDELGVRIFTAEYGRRFVSDHQRKRLFFSIEGLTRTAFEYAYGDRYDEYCRSAYPNT